VTAAGARLTAEHRRLLTVLSAGSSRDVARAWRLFDAGDVAGSWDALLPVLRALVASGRGTASGLGVAYYGRFRAAEGAVAPFLAAPAAALPAEQVAASMRATGLASYSRAVGAGMPPDAASQQAMVAAAGAVSRLVLDADRSVVIGASRSDPEASGWARVASGRACAFCAMLASRGPVYTSEATADFEAHDHCGCAVEPVMDRDSYEWAATSHRYSELWAESTRGLSGADARNAFRRAVESS
jgi:hypothetical protein